MPLPSSGPLTFTDIQTEFGGSNPIGLNEYYAGGGLVPAGTSGTYGAVPSSGTISVQNFYGTTATLPGQVVFSATSGSQTTFTWVAPAGVSKVSVVVVGTNGGQGSGGGSGGGGLGYKNNISVTPGGSYTVVIAARSSTQTTYFCRTCLVSATGGSNGAGGSYVGDGGGMGGCNWGSGNWGGGGGAGGYSGTGGKGGQGQSANGGTAGSGGGGGGGGGACFFAPGGGGGGTGLLGQGSNGAGGARGAVTCAYPLVTGRSFGGGGGSGGGSGSGGTTSLCFCTGQWSDGTSQGGNFGGGAGSNTCHGTGVGGGGAVRIIWPGCARAFPSTRTANE